MTSNHAEPHILIADDDKVFLKAIVGLLVTPTPEAQNGKPTIPATELHRDDHEVVLKWNDRILVISPEYDVAKKYVHSAASLEAAFLDGVFLDENGRQVGTGTDLALDLFEKDIPNIFSVSSHEALYKFLVDFGYDEPSGRGGFCGKSASRVVAILESLACHRPDHGRHIHQAITPSA